MGGGIDTGPEIVTECMYTCTLCGLIDIKVNIPARENGEDLKSWMKTMGIFIANDHDKRNPNCHPKTFTNVKIPMTGTDKVGGPVNQ